METQQEFSSQEKFWMNFKLYQLWRFVVLNFKILSVVQKSKRK